MLRMLFIIFVSLLVYIPHTSIQDVSVPTKNRQQVQRVVAKNDVHTLEELISSLTEQQYQYETAYYALRLNNIFPNFAKIFHERSEQKYNDIKGLIRLCQILNVNINLKPVYSYDINEPLRFLSPDRLNRTNFAQFLSILKSGECKTTFNRLSDAYRQTMNMSIPLQMYLKDKLFMQQILTCKRTSDISNQVDRFINGDSKDSSIPFSFMFIDSRAKNMLSH